ncbi:MAG: coproporphyrinogen dehydrogenase HemZ [Selenomonas sp.]|uniref:coproporphyrinogen dehydrogenase HemZ n=1 Tax=Selenomonas sp. TaxID=2053611 RepID=UPI0025DAB307|nr:coproporphyrinogen dehydrogenase HemZ [Selenomonas sp.]MCR5758509.1 coproporphyrinogen dehydrogenase HemZ [Selenomonas sp.]
MRVRTFTLNTKKEIISKITREVLTLFKVEVVGRDGEADFAQLSVVNHRLPVEGTPHEGAKVCMETTLLLFGRDGDCKRFIRREWGKEDELERAAVNRTIKLNLYRIFCEELGYSPAPWGILHGVRPTKIVHRWISYGMTESAIVQRLMTDFACSEEKARLITPMAFRQLPFLNTSDEKTISIYVGIPFCLTRCLYCSFPANVLPGKKKLAEFMAVLKKDIEGAKAAVQAHGLKVQNIYVGGGTPTALPDDEFRMMLGWVCDAFYHDGLVEFTVEAGRPDSITPGKITAMRDWKVTRVSVNPQTMQQRTLNIIGRQHTPEAVVDMYHALREAGIPHINMDLILGLPGETAADVEDTLSKVTALQPDDITLHALALKRGSRLKLIMEERHVDLPGAEETRRMADVAMAYMDRFGYEPYYLYRQGYMAGDLENIGCCHKGAEGMYNIQIMEEHQTIIGIGGAATSKVVDFKNKRMKSSFNAKDLVTYLRDIDGYIEKRRVLIDEACRA